MCEAGWMRPSRCSISFRKYCIMHEISPLLCSTGSSVEKECYEPKCWELVTAGVMLSLTGKQQLSFGICNQQ